MIKFTNATIVTVNDKQEIIKNGDLVVDNNIIKYVGKKLSKQNELPFLKNGYEQVIDCQENIIMPGFINTHSHAAMTLFRGMAEGVIFEDWFDKKIKPLEDNLQQGDIYSGAKIAISEMLQNGVTSFFDLYFDYTETIKAAKELGARVGVGFGAISGKETLSQGFLQQQYDYLVSSKVIPFVYAHSVYAVDEKQFEELVTFARKHNLVFCTHVSETLTEVGQTHNKYGVTPVGLLENYGVLDLKTVLAHCVHCDKDDVEILKNYNVTVATNPSANLKLGSGIAPVYSFLKNGLNVSIGTDGVASNNALDMFKEMYLAGTLQYGVLNDASLISAEQMLKMATVNGAKAYNINNLGVLKNDYLADIIMLNAKSPNMQPMNNVINNIVFSANPKNVLLTMVDGKIVYNNYKV